MWDSEPFDSCQRESDGVIVRSGMIANHLGMGDNPVSVL